jgi:hypothetical protein
MIWIRQLAREMPFYNHLGMELTNLGQEELRFESR